MSEEFPGVKIALADGYAGARGENGVQVVRIRDGRQSPLPHVIRHSPTGFEWGYGGSGPSDLALSILADVLGHEPLPALYQAFKRDFVAGWERSGWEIEMAAIHRWLQSGGKQVAQN